MADADEIERYEDEETTEFAQDVVEESGNNHNSETEQPVVSDDNQLENQQQPEVLDATVDSDEKFDADEPSPALHPPGETQESTDQNTVNEEAIEKNTVSKDGEDERFSQPGFSNLDRYDAICIKVKTVFLQ